MIHIIDGYEQLNPVARWRTKLRCRRERSGLLITSHRSFGLPTLAELSPSAALVQQIVAELTASRLTPITPEVVADSVARHGSNVREILFDLYDRHEWLTRPARTAAVPAA